MRIIRLLSFHKPDVPSTPDNGHHHWIVKENEGDAHDDDDDDYDEKETEYHRKDELTNRVYSCILL